MDYVVGSIAALISGNVTPNRPKLIRRALTPTKHPSSPNVTPKSEFVEDRSIFLSPTQQKKKAIVKKSPKRIFENPDLDITENSEGSSPKADKVKKHLEEELEADVMGKSALLSKKSPSNKLDKSIQPDSPKKKSKISDSQTRNESTSTKKKRKTEVEVSDNSKVEEMDVDQTTIEIVKKDSKSPKKIKKHKPNADIDHITNTQTEEINKAVEKTLQTENSQEGNKKKNKKRKKKNKKAKPLTNTVENKNEENDKAAEENKGPEENKTKKKKNRKNINKKAKLEANEAMSAKGDQETTAKDDSDDEKVEQHLSDDEKDKIDEDDESDEEISNVANPNAITEKDTDSEHDSDDEVESENEEINKEALKTEDADDSSDDEEVKSKTGAKKKKKEVVQKPDNQENNESPEKEVNTEEEIKRTLFVGNVPFSNKCKKEIKKIFAEYGEIETVRIRTVPVKDGRVTPKLAVIRNEIHPDRSTVNVYVKFTDPGSVDRALAANNTVLSNHHLRVSRSGSTGVEHDPRCAIFLGNLPFGIEDETLRAKFEKCGEIESVRIVRDKKTNAGKGFGYVNFTSKDGVELALELSEEDLTVKNRIIRVKRCTQTLSKGSKNSNKSVKQGPRKDFGNNQGPNRNSGNNQGPNRNFGNQNRNQGPNRNFGNNQGPNRNFGNNQGQRSFSNQGTNRNFGNQGPNRNFGKQGPRNFENQNKFGNQGNDASGASRRIMNKRPHQENGDGPPNKKQNVSQPPRDKKQKKEFVGLTGEKKKKQKFNKDSKKKKVLSEIMTKT